MVTLNQGKRPFGGTRVRRKTLSTLLALYGILHRLALVSAQDFYFTSTSVQLERTYSTLSSSFDYSFNSSYEDVAELYPNCTGIISWIGDGYCDQFSTNNAECGYDGGDCCCCECSSGDSECFMGGFDCIDPYALGQTCLPDDSNVFLCSESAEYLAELYPDCVGILRWIDDEYCDESTNNAECGYDGGDCCCCECSSSDSECFVSGSSCIDPNTLHQICLPNDDTSMSLCSEDYHYLDEKYPNCTGYIGWISDGDCHQDNNNAGCGYDGGDCCCCECSSSDSECFVSGVNCIDPSALDQSCLPEDTRMLLCTESADFLYSMYPNCTGIIDWIGDGYCDLGNTNSAECGYDGGDCCFCQCSSGDSECFLGGSNCIDPYAVNQPCPPEDSTDTTYYIDPSEYHAEQYPNCTGIIDLIGDGECNPVNNNAECGYDSGECCFCQCSSSDSGCFLGGSNCIDPYALNQSCPPEDSTDTTYYIDLYEYHAEQYPNCMGALNWISDGECDQVNNNAECGYDGGDCCPCNCVSTSAYSCGSGGYDCIDPNGGSLENLCTPVPDEIGPCSPDLPVRWELFNSTDVRSFARSIRCSGGTFEAEWHGNITLNETIYISKNTAVRIIGDGALADGSRTSRVFTVVDASLHVSDMKFVNCRAPVGGAVAAARSNLLLEQTEFQFNEAKYGGALFTSNECSVILRDRSLFSGNSANWSGGAVFVTDGLNFSSVGRTHFSSNSADQFGGAMHVRNTSSVYWNGEVIFTGNVAGYGGAVSLWEIEEMRSKGNLTFAGNMADRGDGGAIFIGSQCSVNLIGEVNFNANEAANDGGAIASSRGVLNYRTGLYSSRSITASTDSNVLVSGAAFFMRNKCGGSGGAISLLSGLTMSFEPDTFVTFQENSADVNGGAVHVLGVTFGPMFEGATFVANRAGEDGGGASVALSGDWIVDEKYPYPTSFIDCKFEGNIAKRNGGAISSSAGIDSILHTSFIGNVAGTGGAIRLAGNLARVYGCSFIENISDEGNGPAISNEGILLRIAESSFEGNVFQCPRGMFLDFNMTDGDTRYNEVCANCPNCLWASCFVLENNTLPMCRAVLEHTSSQGGAVNLQSLVVESSYWRATPSSRDILPCYNPDACRGGLTNSPDFCDRRYEGPYCSVCKKGFTSRVQFHCERCEEKNRGIVLIVLSSLMVTMIVLVVAWYLISGGNLGQRQGVIHRIVRHVPVQSVKIIIVAWQIVTQFASAANVTYPEVYQRFLSIVTLLNFELGWVLSAACILDVDFHYRFLTITIGPLVALALLGVTYSVASIRNRHPEALPHIRDKHISVVLWLTLLVYSSASSAVFGMFACDTLEDDEGYRERFLRVDYRINCDSARHRGLEILAGFMVIVYPVGIPCFYAILLFRQRKLLQDGTNRDQIPHLQSISTLWNAYTMERFYYEVIECVRRMWLAGAVAFIYPNTAAQIAVTLVIAVVFAFLCEGLAPYSSTFDAWVSRTGHGIVFFSMYVALLGKVDVSRERSESQEVFAGILVGAHVCMVGAVLIEATVLIFWAKVREEEHPRWLRVKPLSARDVATSSISTSTPSLSISTGQDPSKKARNGSISSLEALSES